MRRGFSRRHRVTASKKRVKEHLMVVIEFRWSRTLGRPSEVRGRERSRCRR